MREGAKRKMRGVVVGHSMKKTIIVRIARVFKHPQYKKYIRRMKNYKVHDERDTCNVGDLVEIVEMRPLSRDKRHRVFRVIEHAEKTEIQKEPST